MCDRIITLIDMDCFFCQVEVKRNPEYEGKPLAVVQYNPWRGGGIIAVNYEARAFGVSRHDRGDDAKDKCPDIILVPVPTERGKADTDRYRKAGREVVDVLCKFSKCVERASVDEAYIDLTEIVVSRLETKNNFTLDDLPNTYVIGESSLESNDEDERKNGLTSWLENISNQNNDLKDNKLAFGAKIVEEIRETIFKETGYRCSAGIAHNKVLAKLACGLHKPNRQTILPHSGVSRLYQKLPVKKIRSLGGKFGDSVTNELRCKVMGDLTVFPREQLQSRFGDRAGLWLYNIARGIDHEPVTPRLISKSIGCCKKFPGKNKLSTKEGVEHWLLQLASELSTRLVRDLEENQRRAQQIVVSVHQSLQANSHSGLLNSYQPDGIAHCAYELIRKYNNSKNPEIWSPPLEYLGLSAGKFIPARVSKKTIESFFKNQMPSTSTEKNKSADNESPTEALLDIVPTLPQLSNPLLNMFYKKLNENKPSTSKINIQNPNIIEQCDDESKEHWISPHEIFPDLEDVDEDVLALLPTPMRNKISSKCRLKAPTIDEIFPNPENIDNEMVEMLPTPMRNEILNKKLSLKYKGEIENVKAGCSKELFPLKKLNNLENGENSPNSPKNNLENGQISNMKPNSSKDSQEKSENCILKNNLDSSNDLKIKRGSNLELTNEKNDLFISSEDNSKEQETKNSSNEEVSEICSQCKKLIPIAEFLEHLDFHTAQNLHRTLNGEGSSTISISPITKSSPVKNSKNFQSKRKRGRGKKYENVDNKKYRSITSYFTPKNEK